jgi:hypothetical protein
MAKFKVGDKVGWNSESGHVTGRIIKVNTKSFTTTGKTGKKYVRHATSENPQYSIKSLISDHVAHHFGSALKKKK